MSVIYRYDGLCVGGPQDGEPLASPYPVVEAVVQRGVGDQPVARPIRSTFDPSVTWAIGRYEWDRGPWLWRDLAPGPASSAVTEPADA